MSYHEVKTRTFLLRYLQGKWIQKEPNLKSTNKHEGNTPVGRSFEVENV